MPRAHALELFQRCSASGDVSAPRLRKRKDQRFVPIVMKSARLGMFEDGFDSFNIFMTGRGGGGKHGGVFGPKLVAVYKRGGGWC
jgi:hypothetical protein